MTSGGYPVQPSVTIPANALSVTISKDGIVSVTQPGTVATAGGDPAGGDLRGRWGLAEYWRKPAGNCFQRYADPEYAGINGSGSLIQRYVETSNVNVAEELVSMIRPSGPMN